MYRFISVFACSLVILLFASCSEGFSPTAPSAPTPTPTPTPERTTSSFRGNIMDADGFGRCLENARAEIIAGPLSGTTYPQNRELCEEWSNGFSINDLPIGAVLTLRVSAPGYTSVERDFVIGLLAHSIDINLKRAE